MKWRLPVYILCIVIIFLTFTSICVPQIQPIVRWTQTNGPYGGYINCFAISNGIIYCGTNDGGLFLSTNNGSNWSSINKELPSENINAIAISGSNIFIGMDYSGVFRSTDNGNNWTQVNTGLTSTYIHSLTIFGSNIFAGAYGIFRSTNNGTDWVEVRSTSAPVRTFAVLNTFLFAGSSNGILISSDNGNNWTEALTDNFVSVIFVTGQKIFAGTDFGKIFLSTDNGQTWLKRSSGLGSSQITGITSLNNILFAGTPHGIYYSTNDGENWTKAYDGEASDINCLISDDTYMYKGTGGDGIYRYHPNTFWIKVNTGLINTYVKGIVPVNSNLFAATTIGCFLSTDKGESWNEKNTGLQPTRVNTYAYYGSKIFIGTDGYGVFLSTNNGNNWIEANTGIDVNDRYIHSFAISDEKIFVGTDGGVYLSTNAGNNWVKKDSGLTTKYVRTIITSNQNIFAGTFGGGVFKSTDNGQYWVQVNSGLTSPYVYALALSGSTLYAGTANGGIFLSTNNGSSWSNSDSGLTTSRINALVVFDNKIFAGTEDNGVFVSSNNGISWNALNLGLKNTYIKSLAVLDTFLYAGTEGSGVWKRSISDFTTAVSQTENVPLSYCLYQNYPNPFNPSTKIGFVIPASSLNPFYKGEGTLVTLKVYDVLGNEVATLVNEEKPTGSYEVDFNAASLPSGVYFYQLRAGSFVETKKMLLLK